MIRWILSGIVFVAVFAGVVWLAVHSYFSLAWKGEVTPLDLASLLLNIFLIYFLNFYVVPRLGDRRAEKDVLVDHLRDLITTMRACRDAMQDCYDSHSKEKATKVLLSLRTLNNAAFETSEILAMSCCSDLGTPCTVLRDGVKAYRLAATGGKFPAGRYTALQLSEQTQAYEQLSRAIYSLMFTVNKHS